MKTFSQSSKMTETKSSLSPLANRFLLRVLFFGKDDEDKK